MHGTARPVRARVIAARGAPQPRCARAGDTGEFISERTRPMRKVRRGTVPAVVAGMMLASAAQAALAADDATQVLSTTSSTTTTSSDVAQELQALRARIQQLETQEAARAAKADAAAQAKTVESVIADADARSQLLQMQGFTAGWNKGKFILQSENGDFTLMPGFWMQLRYVANYREEDAANTVDGDAAAESGFEVRRMKLAFDGNAFGPNFKYRFLFNTNRSNGEVFLEEAFGTYKFNNWLGLKAGQYKDPTFHEELTSDMRQLAAERSLVNFTLGGGVTDRVQGVALIVDDGPDGSAFRGEAGFTDGPNSKNTSFVDGGGSAFLGQASPDFGLYARGEYLFTGDWKNYEDFTPIGTEKTLVVAGGGASYSQAGDNNMLLHTVDVQYERGPVGAYAAYYGAYTDQAGAGSFYDAGLLVQASYMFTPKWEAFGRYEFIYLDDERDTGEDTFNVIAAGVNYYMSRSHAAKLTVDLSYLPDGTPINADGAGILDPDADGDQFVLRGQFQLML
jgi:hypothetical protein